MVTVDSELVAGRYPLNREIGRGGSGVVWLGRDEVLGRAGGAEADRPAARRRQHRPRARRARGPAQRARLNHPHVVAVFDVVTEEPRPAGW